MGPFSCQYGSCTLSHRRLDESYIKVLFSPLPILPSPPLLTFSQFLKHFKARPSYVALLRRNRRKGPAKGMGASFSSVRPYPKKERRKRQQQLGRKLWGEGGGGGTGLQFAGHYFSPLWQRQTYCGSGWRRRGRKIFFHARPHSYELHICVAPRE